MTEGPAGILSKRVVKTPVNMNGRERARLAGGSQIGAGGKMKADRTITAEPGSSFLRSKFLDPGLAGQNRG